jgi:kojibiose phosphorylase
VRVADWTRLSITIEGQPLQLDRGRWLEHRRILDLQQGMLWRQWRHQDEFGRVTRLEELRVASLANRHLLVQSVTLTAENYNGNVTIDATPTGPLIQLTKSGLVIAMALRLWLSPPLGGSISSTESPVHQLRMEQGETRRVDRVVAVCTSRDSDDPIETASTHAERAMDDISLTIAHHRDAWLARWQASDIRIEGDADAQRALRFAIYHLSSAANPEDERVSVGARGLSGLAYMGHVFWDTDIFMLPFFALTYPEAARALVMYRYHTLAGARAKAARLGHRGALYAWESADNGDEVTPPFVIGPDGEVIRILTGEQEHHISADVAFAVWNYWQATGDERFLLGAGAEILIETARFWASRAVHEDDRRYHIRGVIGPDEYHETVDDNAYTNGLAQWNLEVAEEVTRLLAERWPAQWRELSRRLGLDADEPADWLRVARDLYTGFDERTGLFEQFQGYFGLEDIDLAAFRSRTVPDGCAPWCRAHTALPGHQAARCGDAGPSPVGPAAPRGSEGQLRVLRAALWTWQLAQPGDSRAGRGPLGQDRAGGALFRPGGADRSGQQHGNSAGGIHSGVMGGLWQTAVLGFAGLDLTQEDPALRPSLPPSWRSLSMRVQWRGQWHQLSLPHGVEERTKGASHD